VSASNTRINLLLLTRCYGATLPAQLDLPTLCTTLENLGRTGVMKSLAAAHMAASARRPPASPRAGGG